ncbi:GH36-type glycosyl hydrolase domain-containing protein [Cellulomonas soli]|uniref:N,N'-diacetylchitobiose phosphorylase n=1 Tax=Cellulomonas soli TaxID=931535 RepID=A0A512PC68_9CELL|nr:N,N'-diacetylchitobiose phosphorylase [Cellulomonas soli]NYI58376.1 N,N'-diacetylchitobiose phosphorylase [Cellulomonas soli]GEP68797.1 N,N'-diacetylchitobiose phosphorylase [Cellulomonas soli]
MRYGHFDTARDEYVVERPDVPVSWTNYLGTKNLCTVISHAGGAYSYYKSSQYGRITRFRQNGVPLDRPGHYVYLRDAADGDYWSVSWQPVGKPLAADGVEGGATYTTRHGMGYTRFEASYKGVDASQTVFVPLDDDVEVWDVEVTNRSDVERRLTVGSYVEFSFHTITIDNQNLQMSLYASGSSYADGVIEYDFYYEPWTHHFFTSSEEPSSWDSLREEFIGPYRSESNPIAIERGHGSNRSATTQNHCGSLQHEIVLAPGETKRLVFLLGYGSRDEVGRAMRAKYADLTTVDVERARLRAYWAAKQDRLRIRTPHEGMNTMINTWTLLQAETCVQWSRFASFVEVGGRNGLGYRDTAQDVMSVIHSNPTKTRQRIVELLRAQTEAGYGLHLFDPAAFDPDAPTLPDVPSPTIVPTPDRASLIHGLEDTCSDDHLWLVPSVVEYVKETGDLGFLDEVIPFAEGTPGTVYEHLRRALDFSSQQVGPNGVALGLRADWNDCLNLGGGQTALVTFLHAWAVRAFLEVAEPLGRTDDVERYRAELDRIARVADTELWDGDWWIRGYTRDGVTIGSHQNAEGRIFLEHQAWPVIAGITSHERGTRSMDSVRELLGSPYGNHLNWPAFTQVDDTVGFVTRVYPGIKENAAIFSHPNAWPIIAEALLGRGDEAVQFYDAILPYHQNDNIEVRGAEPYAYVQFLYGRDHEWFGKAQNPWLTGTAGWMYTAVTKYVLGVRLTLDGLVVDPAIPHDWDGFEMRREWRGTVYDIEVRNPDRVSHGVRTLVVDGVDQDPAAPVTARPAGSQVHVVVTLGAR